MAINFNALAPADVGGSFFAGLEHGRAVARQRQTDAALAQYAQNPNDMNANALIAVDPRLGLQVQTQRQEQAQQQQAFDLKRLSLLDDQRKEMLKRRVGFMGEQALYISQLPPQQQPQAWDAAIEQGVQMGFDDLAQYRGKYSGQALQQVLAESGKIQEALGLSQPRSQAVTMPDGSVQLQYVPRTPVQFGGQPQAAPQGAMPPPPPGFVLDNGGPTQPASGGFR